MAIGERMSLMLRKILKLVMPEMRGIFTADDKLDDDMVCTEFGKQFHFEAVIIW